MQRRDPAQLLVGRVGADALKERADLPRPLLQICAKKRQLVFVRKLGGEELVGPSTFSQPHLAAHAQVAHPLRLASGRHEVTLALELERIDGRAPPLAALPPAYLQDTRADEADAEAGQPGDDWVEDMLREPPGALVVGLHRSHFERSNPEPGQPRENGRWCADPRASSAPSRMAWARTASRRDSWSESAPSRVDWSTWASSSASDSSATGSTAGSSATGSATGSSSTK